MNKFTKNNRNKKEGETIMTKGRYGIHGGQYIPETLMNAVIELEKAYNYYKNDKELIKLPYGSFIQSVDKPLDFSRGFLRNKFFCLNL